MINEKKRLIIIDSNSIIHRAFHALPPLTTKKGEIVGAVYGFLLVFFRAIKEFQPDYFVATFDFPAPTFRHKRYKEYKAKRPPTPKELSQQIPKIKEILKSFNISIFEKQGFEADDIIGTLASQANLKTDVETIIFTGDKDVLQLINEKTKVHLLRRGVKDIVLYDEGLVKEKEGLEPKQLLDFKALRGDPSDNILGVSGIGEKTAIELILKFGNLDNLYKELREKSEKAKGLKLRIREILLRHKEQAFLSKDLVQIDLNVSVDFNLERCLWGKYDKEKVVQTLKNLEFYSLIKKLPTEQKEEENLVGRNLKLW